MKLLDFCINTFGAVLPIDVMAEMLAPLVLVDSYRKHPNGWI